MEIFLSYASEDRSKVEPVALAFGNAGHKVFFDDHSLQSGKSFDETIQEAIRRSDLFVFFISKDSTEEGRYTLSELEFAKSKWKAPSGYILPVLIDEVELDQIPAYLRSVTILTPRGNLTAEVVSNAINLNKQRRSHRWILVSLASFSLVGLSGWFYTTTDLFDYQLGTEQQINSETRSDTAGFATPDIQVRIRDFGISEFSDLYEYSGSEENPQIVCTGQNIVFINKEDKSVSLLYLYEGDMSWDFLMEVPAQGQTSLPGTEQLEGHTLAITSDQTPYSYYASFRNCSGE